MTARKDPYKLVSGPAPLVNIGATARMPSRQPRPLFRKPSRWQRLRAWFRAKVDAIRSEDFYV